MAGLRDYMTPEERINSTLRGTGTPTEPLPVEAPSAAARASNVVRSAARTGINTAAKGLAGLGVADDVRNIITDHGTADENVGKLAGDLSTFAKPVAAAGRLAPATGMGVVTPVVAGLAIHNQNNRDVQDIQNRGGFAASTVQDFGDMLTHGNATRFGSWLGNKLADATLPNTATALTPLKPGLREPPAGPVAPAQLEAKKTEAPAAAPTIAAAAPPPQYEAPKFENFKKPSTDYADRWYSPGGRGGIFTMGGAAQGALEAAKIQNEQVNAINQRRATQANARNMFTLEGARLAENQRQANMDTQTKQAELGLRTAQAKRQADQSQLEMALKLRADARAEEQQNFGQKEAATKNISERLGKMYTTTDAKGNQVVDSAKVADRMQAISGLLGVRANALAQIPPTDPRYKQAQAELKTIQTKGIAGLDEDNLQTMTAQLDLRDRAAQSHSPWNPFGGTFVDSANPNDYDIVGKKKGILQDQYILRGGSTIPVNDTRYTEPANAILPDVGKVQTRRFDIIKRGLRE